MSTRTTLLLTLGILILEMGISTFFILSRGHVVINRYIDATWHMVAADEFARTGVFAKDPFIQNAPRFASFGLWDFINGLIQRLFDLPVERVFVASNAVTVTLFLLASYLAGAIATGGQPADYCQLSGSV